MYDISSVIPPGCVFVCHVSPFVFRAIHAARSLESLRHYDDNGEGEGEGGKGTDKDKDGDKKVAPEGMTTHPNLLWLMQKSTSKVGLLSDGLTTAVIAVGC